jgi:hypothetical protein
VVLVLTFFQQYFCFNFFIIVLLFRLGTIGFHDECLAGDKRSLYHPEQKHCSHCQIFVWVLVHCLTWHSINVKRGIWVPLTGLISDSNTFCACLKTEPTRIPNAMCHDVLFMLNEVRWEVIVCVVDLVGFVGYHCLNVRFMWKGVS